MKKAESISFCDKAEAEKSPRFGFAERGGNMFFSVAYPSAESRSDKACEKFSEIAKNSFMQRPSVCDEAMREIPQFIARSIFAVQEPEKIFLAHGAAVFIHKGKARCFLSGNAHVLFISEGKIIFSSEPLVNPMIGAKIKYDGVMQPEIALPHSGGIFILCCGEDSTELSLSDLTPDDADFRKWAELVCSSAGKRVSFTAVNIPAKEKFFFTAFKGKNKNG